MAEGPFGFFVGRTKSHQCDSWDIAGEGEYGWGEQHEVAVAALERFIAEAQSALDALRDQREVERRG